jgi:hypothetical protein
MKHFQFIGLLAVLLFTISSTVSAQYVGSSKSDKYHSSSCKHAERISDENRVEFKTVEEAKEAGYVACKVCKPGDDSSSSNTDLKTKNLPESSGGRCQATTKKGTQCKRSAQDGSEYCWQHAK